MVTYHASELRAVARRVRTKLGVSDRTQAAVRGIELGLITRPPSTRPS